MWVCVCASLCLCVYVCVMLLWITLAVQRGNSLHFLLSCVVLTNLKPGMRVSTGIPPVMNERLNRGDEIQRRAEIELTL